MCNHRVCGRMVQAAAPLSLLTSICTVGLRGASLQVVLIDEALAPLDPVSKQLVQKQLKAQGAGMRRDRA